MKNKKESFGYEDAAYASEYVANQVAAANLDPNEIRDGLILGSGLGSFAETHMDENSDADVYKLSLANQLADKPDFMIDLGDTMMSDKLQPITAPAIQSRASRAKGVWTRFQGTRESSLSGR